eukprot:765376-Hanusia_phi.AAC.7
MGIGLCNLLTTIVVEFQKVRQAGKRTVLWEVQEEVKWDEEVQEGEGEEKVELDEREAEDEQRNQRFQSMRIELHEG